MKNKNYAALVSKILVWSGLLAILFVLRSFFLLIFLTFLFAYIQTTMSNKLEPWISSRRIRVFLCGSIFLSVLVAAGWFLVPKLRTEASVFIEKFPGYLNSIDASVEKLGTEYPILGLNIGNVENPRLTEEVKKEPSQTIRLIQSVFGGDSVEAHNKVINQSLDVLRNIGGTLIGISSAFFLALIFSFLIVLDLPRLHKSLVKLSKSRLDFIYNEVAESIRDFGFLMGKAIEAQLYIAILNTILTALGLIIIGLSEKLVFISFIVFFCSFIPVAGVFISSLPICLMALQAGGFYLLFLAVTLITLIHMIEAYILNPKIYGHHLRMNPVIVLIILTVGGKLFGIWGLILGVPICNYIFGHAIHKKAPSLQ